MSHREELLKEMDDMIKRIDQLADEGLAQAETTAKLVGLVKVRKERFTD